MALPTFLIPGAAKAGSSTLYECFASHPQILMSDKKEPGFFHQHWEAGLSYYERFFTHYRGEMAVGEATVGYMPDPRVPLRIHQVLPDVKLIFSLREPVSRAVSHYWWRVHHGTESRTFDEILDSPTDNYPVELSLYYSQICRFLEFFPSERMHFILTEAMARDLNGVLRGAFEFLGVGAGYQVPAAGPSNQARAPRSATLAKAVSTVRRSELRRLVPSPLRSFGGNLLVNVNQKAFRPPPLRPDQRRRLQEVFAPEIAGLERDLGLDLSCWRRKG